jgi:8-oxo-dGTP diphosphatase
MGTGARHSVSVAAAIIREDGRVLMIQRRDNGKWEPPGGVLELDESILDGLRREVREETGLEIEPLALTGVYKNMPRAIVALVFKARITGGNAVTTTSETSKLDWFTPDQISTHSDEAYAVRVLDALTPTGSAAIRSHDGFALLPEPASRE